MSEPSPSGHPVPPHADALRASVVITTFRRTAMLAEALAALLPQVRGRAAEIIVVDNCPDASARQVVQNLDDAALNHLHEPRPGVVHARNRGVAAAKGAYVIFLDDDEIPDSGWLDAWLVHADGCTDASFGRVVPRPLGPCPSDLAEQVGHIFSRDMHRPAGADISASWAYLGTGNAMFHKTRCLGAAEPFDARFNARGGEDVWLIRGLVREGRRLLWNPDAVVDELVPEDRMTLPSLRSRRFNQGQLRCILMFGNGGAPGVFRAAIWMLVGVVQYAVFGLAARIAALVAPDRQAGFLCRASGGAGKMLWWRKARTDSYAAR